MKTVRKCGKNAPPRGPCPRLSTAPPLPCKLPGWEGSCNLTWFPSLPQETSGSSFCQVSLLCPGPWGVQPLATQVLTPGPLNTHSSHWVFHPPQSSLPPSKAFHSALQKPRGFICRNPCISNFISGLPCPSTPSPSGEEAFWKCQVLVVGDWVLLLPGR